jgi:Ca2+-binding RTX toxin-like protein
VLAGRSDHASLQAGVAGGGAASACRTLPRVWRCGTLLLAALLVAAPVAEAAAQSRTGTPGRDRLRGNPTLPNEIFAMGGGDTVLGGAGADRLWGETGGDRVFGRAGDDMLHGGSGDDRVEGWEGNDAIVGDFGHDTIEGGPGNDVIDAGGAGDQVSGGPGNDLIHGGRAGDTLDGGDGDDEIHSDSGPETILGGVGNDRVHINVGDLIELVDCGPGADTIYIDPPGTEGGDSHRKSIRQREIANCESIIPARRERDPTLGVTRYANSRGGGTLRGTERNDTLLGGPGGDLLLGREGNDVLWGNRLPRGGSYGTDRIVAGAGADIVYGGRGRNRIRGQGGNDYLQGGAGSNAIGGGAGDDHIYLRGDGSNRVNAGVGNDRIDAYARTASITIDCGAGGDVVNIGFNRSVRTDNCEQVNLRYEDGR